MYGKNVKNIFWTHFFMKKREQLQVILNNSKSEVEQGGY